MFLDEALHLGGRLPARRAVPMALSIARTVAVSHRRGHLRLALSPRDVELIPGLSGEEVELGPPGRMPIEYAAPEQTNGLTVDRRTDVYLIGALLYQLVTGHAPERARRMAASPIPAENGLLEIFWVIDRCLEADPNDRYQDVDVLVGDLEAVERFLESMPPEPLAQREVIGTTDLSFGEHPFPDPPSWMTPRMWWIPIALAIAAGNAALYLYYSKEPDPVAASAAAPGAPPPIPAPAPAPPVVARETQVDFRSHPYGAQVYEGDRLLGQTPLVRVYPRPTAPEEHLFRFELDGHLELEVSRPISGERTLVDAQMIPDPAPRLAAKPRRQRRRRAPEPVAEPAAVADESVPRVGDDEYRVPRVGDSDVERVPKLKDKASVPRVGDDDEEIPRL